MNNRKVYTKDMVINILRKNFDKNFKLDLVSLARYAYKLIPINIDEAEYIYSYIITSLPIFNYKRQLNCLKNMILERKKYLDLSESQKEQYKFLQAEGKKLYKKCDLVKECNCDIETKILYKKEKLAEAYDYYLTGLYVTQHNIFNYYLGKMCYKNRYVEEAREYLENYIKNGGEKLSKSLLYLNRIYRIKKMKNKSQFFSERMLEITEFFEDDFEFLSLPLPYEYYIKNNGNKDINYVGIFEQPKMSNNLKEKLENIKNLILVHQDKKADKLILELEREKNNMDDEDRKAFLQFQKNKKLYRVKR